MALFSPDIPMSTDEFRLLRDFVYQHCGLHFREDSQYILQKRLGKRVLHHRLKSFKDYYYLLRYGAQKEQEMAEAIDLLTTNETYFFREDFQLRAFTEEILPEIIERKTKEGSRRLRIWSAGCSTGEEPYTLAMLILEQPSLEGWEVEIIGTDISQRVLQVARKATYGSFSFRSTDEAFKKKYFTEVEGKYKVCDRVRHLVSISHLNLFDPSRVLLLGRMDVIFCRNVIIYFDLSAKRKVIDTFFQRLSPEGFLLLGHSESLMNISNDFVLRHFSKDMVYQRPAPASFQEAGGA